MKCQNCGHETGQRTLSQNNALYLFFKQLSEKLNEMGLDMKAVMSDDYDIWWTPESVKKHLWGFFMKNKYGHTSTTQLRKTGQIEAIHEELMHRLGEKHGVEYVPFPSVFKCCKHIGCVCGAFEK